MSLVRGLTLGRVKALDNSHRGQVQVEFENEANEQCGITYDWARVVSPMAGNDRGEWLMPEVGDEVVVGFADDEAVDPYVLGYVWSEPPGTNAKPPNGAAFTQRRFKSKKGHMLTFDDGDANMIELKSAGGNVVTLDDANSKLVVQSSQGYTVTLDQNGMELKVGGRKIAITPSTIELT
jgi:uncharacterized protein involved in type VI secretion and phage assembly